MIKLNQKRNEKNNTKLYPFLCLLLLFSTSAIANDMVLSVPDETFGPHLNQEEVLIVSIPFKQWGVYGSFAYFDTWLPGKYGLSASYNTDKRDYELAFQTARYSLNVVVANLGSITDQRLHLTTRSYKGDSFNIQYGLSMNTFEVKLGDNFWGEASNSTVNVLKIQTLGVIWGIGNRWSWDNGLTIGADWFRIFYPITVVEQEDDFLKGRPDSSQKEDVKDLIDAVSQIPTFTIAHFEIGYRF